MDKVLLGVVGLGHRGRHLFKIAKSFENVVPVAACDLKPSNWTETQALSTEPMEKQFPDTKFYTDFDKMLAESGINTIIVETGADVHAAFCAKALEHNINVLSDIPVVATLEEADLLWETAKKSSAMFSTGANPNESRYTAFLKDFYKQGFLGKPYCMEAEYIHWYLPGSFEDRILHENGEWRKLLSPIRYCTHSLGPLLSILEEDLTKVSCFGTGKHAPAEDYYGDARDDMQCAQFQTDSGVVVRLMRNGRCRAKIGYHTHRVFGTEGYFERMSARGKEPIKVWYNTTKFRGAHELTGMDGRAMPYEYEDDPKAVGHDGVDYAMEDHFFKALLAGLPAPIPLKEGLRMTIPGIYAEMSAMQGGKILDIKYPWNK